MREEDFVPLRSQDELAGWIIQVPRHKKGDVHSRAAFRRRKLNGLFGEIVRDLIESNASCHGYSYSSTRPLFRKRGQRLRRLLDNEWQNHVTASTFTKRLKEAVERLGTRSRSGELLYVTCRRFRYSLATRMVQNGASQAAVGDALDHSDLQNVSVYWEISSDIVEHLDGAMSLALAPHAQAFAGIVGNEGEAIRGSDPSSRRYFIDPATQQLEAVGTCGHFGFCNITAPLACYACVKFQAWMDGPHQEVLDMLLRRRESRRELGLHPKMVGIEDELISAVQNTLARIEAMRAAEA